MALGRQDISVARADGSADIFCLASFLRDDDLICHDGPTWEDVFNGVPILEHIVNTIDVQALRNPNPDRSSLGSHSRPCPRAAISLPRIDLDKTDDAPFSMGQLTNAHGGWIMRYGNLFEDHL